MHLAEKLSIHPQHSMTIVNLPTNIDIENEFLLKSISVIEDVSSSFDAIILFIQEEMDLWLYLQNILPSLKQQGCFWICCPSEKEKKDTLLACRNIHPLYEKGYHLVSSTSLNEEWLACCFCKKTP